MSDSIENESLNVLRAMARDIRANTVSRRSKTTYVSSYSKFISWLVLSHQQLITPAFLAAIDPIPSDATAILESVKKLFNQEECPKPLHFEQLKASDFVIWLLTLRKRNGKPLSYSALNTHRAGLFNLYRDYGVIMSTEVERELKTHFKGLKRDIAQRTANGDVRIKTGKDPLSIDTYQFLVTKLLRGNKLNTIFARTYMIIAWNLMCRSSNAFSIRYEHIEWSNDALCIYFAHMKNDQAGDRPRDPRHIYANPITPALCPILALGIYWSCSQFDLTTNQLFPGANQYERFRKELMVILDIPEVASELLRRGIRAEDIGTHSLRKGASTFCSSGTTACPSSTAVHLRAGWALGGVQDTYLRYESAGDQYVGRTVCGLPILSPNFATLPPHFIGDKSRIEYACRLMFPNSPSALRYVLEFALASIVHHSEFLLNTLDSGHPIFQTPIFASTTLMDDLKQLVHCGLETPAAMLRATGIPPHVALLKQMSELSAQTEQTVNHIDHSASKVVDDVVNELDRRAIGGGSITANGLREAIMECLNSSGLNAIVESLRSSIPEGAANDDELATNSTGDAIERCLPVGYEIPNCSIYNLWLLWCCGSQFNDTPPLRYAIPGTKLERNLQRRLSDLRFIMRRIERRATELGMMNSVFSQDEAHHIFAMCKESVAVSPITLKSRKRRRGQLSWVTVVKLLRNQTEI